MSNRSVSPVVFFGILHGALFELLVHLPVEVVPQEERPEPEQGVHLLRLADAQALPLWNTESPSGTRAQKPVRSVRSAEAPFRHRRRYLW